MISKFEWHAWKELEVTKKLVELVNVGLEQAKEEMVANRGNVSDFERGAIYNAREILDIIRQGDFLVEGTED